MEFLMNVTISFCLILAFIAWHAYADANKKLRQTEALYNKQPRIKPLHHRLAWSGRIITWLSLKILK